MRDDIARQEPGVNIREMTEEDIEGVLAIDRRTMGSDRAITYTDTTTSYVGGELDVSVVAEVGEQVIGFLFGRVTDSPYGLADTASLELVGVDPEQPSAGHRHQAGAGVSGALPG